MQKRLKVLLLNSDEAESSILRDLLSKHVIVTWARNVPETLGLLDGSSYDALFCNWCFHMGTWHDALKEVQKRYPELPTVIVCRTGEEREWVEVLEAGAVDLLSAPYRECTILAVLEHALASRDARALNFVPLPR